MKMSKSKQGNVTVFAIGGRLDTSTARDFEQWAREQIDRGDTHLVVDCNDLEYVSSAGLRVFLMLAKAVKAVQGSIALAATNEQVGGILDMAGFDALIHRHADVTEAVAAVSGVSTTDAAAGLSTAKPYLNFPEELALLALDDDSGTFNRLPARSLDFAMVGAALMDLALLNRVDCDTQSLRIVSKDPTGDPVLDPLLQQLPAGDARTIAKWIDHLGGEGVELRQRALDQLVAKGILQVKDEKWLWVFQVRKYPIRDDREIREVETRLRDIILGDEIPDARDVVLISLVNACRFFERILNPEEWERSRDRIVQLAKMDLIGQAMTQAIRRIEAEMSLAFMM